MNLNARLSRLADRTRPAAPATLLPSSTIEARKTAASRAAQLAEIRRKLYGLPRIQR
jgi:hypothetical protein